MKWESQENGKKKELVWWDVGDPDDDGEERDHQCPPLIPGLPSTCLLEEALSKGGLGELCTGRR